MVRPREAGFTLIEIMLVLAISSSLAVIAFMGQSALRSQAQFDATVNKTVAEINSAHTQSAAGVNTSALADAGTGTNRCAGPAGNAVFAGTAWTLDNSGSMRIDYYRTTVDASGAGVVACIFSTQSIGMDSPLTISGMPSGGRVLFVRDQLGALVVCTVPNTNISILPSFTGGACVAPAVTPLAVGTTTFTVKDTDGHKSDIIVDVSGLARRNN